MAISVTKLHTRLAREFGASESSERFADAFKDAINDAIDDLNDYTSLELDYITSLSGSIPVSAGQYQQALLACARASISDSGEWGRTPKGDLLALKQRALGAAQTRYQDDNPPTVRMSVDDEDEDEA